MIEVKPPIQLRVRVADMPTTPVPSIVEKCANCSEPVWTSKSVTTTPLYQMGTILCEHCMIEYVESL